MGGSGLLTKCEVLFLCICGGHRKPGKLWNFIILFSSPGKSWNLRKGCG